MKGRLEATISPVLQSIPNVDSDGPGDWVTRDPQPRLHSFLGGGALASAHLQPSLTYVQPTSNNSSNNNNT